MIQYLTLDDVAHYFSVSLDTVQRWVEAGDLRAFRKGRVVRVANAEVMRFEMVHRRLAEFHQS